MKNIFEQGEFSQYRVSDLRKARERITEDFSYGDKRILTIFLSHKHDEIEELKDIIGFLEKEYNARVYIDSRDPAMPVKTSSITAGNIKNRIKKCDKFILIATNAAVESKWCNWELGFGDAHKYLENIAIFPIKPKDSNDYSYKGNEYLSIYPYIAYYNGSEKYSNGSLIGRGYYVKSMKDDIIKIEPLKEWLTISKKSTTAGIW